MQTQFQLFWFEHYNIWTWLQDYNCHDRHQQCFTRIECFKFKKNKDNIDKLINLIKIDQKKQASLSILKQFLHFLFCQRYRFRLGSKRSLNFLSKLSRSCILITHEQLSSIKYKKLSISHYINNQLSCLLIFQSISNKYRFKLLQSILSIWKTVTIVLSLNIK